VLVLVCGVVKLLVGVPVGRWSSAGRVPACGVLVSVWVGVLVSVWVGVLVGRWLWGAVAPVGVPALGCGVVPLSVGVPVLGCGVGPVLAGRWLPAGAALGCGVAGVLVGSPTVDRPTGNGAGVDALSRRPPRPRSW
jgi:hypothetical protein